MQEEKKLPVTTGGTVATDKAIELKKTIKEITSSLEKLPEIKGKVEGIVAKWDDDRKIDIFNEDDRLFIDNYSRELRTTRTPIENERKRITGFINPVTKEINVSFNEITSLIEGIELKVKPYKDSIKEEEEKEKNARKAEKEKVLHEKIAILTELGAVMVEGYYTIRDEEKNENIIEIQAADINTLSDVTWENLIKVAQEKKSEMDKRIAEAKQKSEEDAKALADSIEKNRLEKEALQKERLDMRMERLEGIGFSIENDVIFHNVFDIKSPASTIIEMDNEQWKEFVESTKNNIAELAKQKAIADAKAKEEAEQKEAEQKEATRQKEITDYLRSEYFSIENNTAIYKKDGFEYSFGLEEEDIDSVKRLVSISKSEEESYKKRQSEIKLKKQAVYDKFSDIGMVASYSDRSLRMPSLIEGRSHILLLSDIDEMNEEQINHAIAEAIEFKNNVIAEKEKADAEAKELAEKEKAQRQSDGENLEQFVKDILALASKFKLSTPELQDNFGVKLQSFIKSL